MPKHSSVKGLIPHGSAPDESDNRLKPRRLCTTADSPILTLFSQPCVAKATDLPKVALSLGIPPEIPKWRADCLARVRRDTAVSLIWSVRYPVRVKNAKQRGW